MSDNLLNWRKTAILALILVILSGTLFDVDGQSEQCNDLHRCVNMLKALTSDENIAFAHTERDLENLCKRLKEAVVCVNTFISRCLDHTSQVQYLAMTNGTQKLINELCTNGTPFRTEYLKHAKCYHQHANDYKVCAEQYYSNYEKLKDKPEEDYEIQIKNWCCNFDSHRKCTHDTVYGKCGKDAANLAENIVITAGGILVDVHCKNYTNNSPQCYSVMHSVVTSYTSSSTKRVILPFVYIMCISLGLMSLNRL